MGATHLGIAHTAGGPGSRHTLLLVLVALALMTATAARAQDARVPSPSESGPKPPADAGAGRGERVARFLLGGAAGLGLHEGSHVIADASFGVKPTLKGVRFGPFPFFAISHRAGLPPRQEFTISSAGFWMQHLSSEVVLTRHPELRAESAPVLKGILAFNVLASVAYGGAAFARVGPSERDTRGMAVSLRVKEPWIGALVLTPACLDAWRYFHPESRWAKWLSRGVKVGAVVLVVR